MSKAETHRRSPEFHQRIFALLVGAFVLLALYLLHLPLVQPVGRLPSSQSWRNLRRINLALDTYFQQHGAYPYHPDGPNSALYALHEVLDASRFDSYPHHNPSPDAYWDHATRRLMNSDFLYLNDPNLSDWPKRVIVAERLESPSQTWVWIGLSGGWGSWRDLPEDGRSSLLGDYATSDGFGPTYPSLEDVD